MSIDLPRTTEKIPGGSAAAVTLPGTIVMLGSGSIGLFSEPPKAVSSTQSVCALTRGASIATVKCRLALTLAPCGT